MAILRFLADGIVDHLELEHVLAKVAVDVEDVEDVGDAEVLAGYLVEARESDLALRVLDIDICSVNQQQLDDRPARRDQAAGYVQRRLTLEACFIQVILI